MEQGAARERATERPSPPFGDATGTARPEPARATFIRSEPARPGSARATSPGPEPSPTESARTAPPRPGPSRAEAVRVPEQTRGAEPGRSAEHARGEHTHDEPTAPGPRTVRRHSVRGQILEALRTALVGGELRPGEVYSAPVLAERFGVSATPVREAMQRLAVEGAVEVVPNRGFRVTERTPRELAELAEVRALIEVPVMLRLARTVPAARWAELRPLAEATATAAARGDRAHYAETDRAFHRAVLSLAGNEQLLAVADDLHRRSQWPLISAPALRHGDLVADAAEHTALLDALIAQDLGVVQALVREHFAGSEC
ncbi:FCD domain-containing protein [Streptomyces sp. NPDC053513]|uniref:FCD domain-containing protein n=1 Tax=Streptomyces litmocidini TaxID=67318 RepID=A0ABW7UJK2_9ACTN